jgi:voltage-gated potassium channel
MVAPVSLQRWEERSEWPLAGVALGFLIAYSVQVLAQPNLVVDRALEFAIGVAWFIFGIDYVVRLALANNRVRWFFRHLIDLAIVALPFLRPLRLLRLLVLFGALQKAIGGAFRGQVILYTALSTVLMIYVASLAILDAERDQPGSRIVNFGDAVWWSITTVTTVGYGDLSPVTTQGRVIAVFLMIGGISLVGVVTATIASWIIQRVSEEDKQHRSATAAQIDQLRTEIGERLDQMASELRRLHGRAGDGEYPAPGERAIARGQVPGSGRSN